MTEPYPTRAEDVFSTLRYEVLTGQYRPGERLPSERELALRFESGRGAIREALRKLETLGLIKSARGGARVAALDEASLDVLGPLLDLHPVPDAELVDQCLQVLELLVGDACDHLLARGTETAVDAVRERIDHFLSLDAHDPDLLRSRLALGQTMLRESGNLPMRLIANGLRMQLADRLWTRLPDPDEAALEAVKALLRDLSGALATRNRQSARRALQALMQLNRQHLRTALCDAGATQDVHALIPTPPPRGLTL
ncbi:MAG: HTH-type transcriptional regulator Mce2R [Pseudomonadota bacterium]|jgi:GntR family transcriptional repressor for pyruvate dehydrogenase complex|nr:FadR family transcriptional regulator [Pseudomonadales bacterium]MBL6808744.1 FadR family transcriptional regulator [Pseudomonadales bacterium]